MVKVIDFKDSFGYILILNLFFFGKKLGLIITVNGLPLWLRW